MNPIKESFMNPENRRIVLIALFGATAGQGVVWYTGQFYAMFFLQKVVNIGYETSLILVATALVLGTPFFVLFGSLSDRIGRKPVILGGLLLAAVLYIPLFMGLSHFARPLNHAAIIAILFVMVLLVAMTTGPSRPIWLKSFRPASAIRRCRFLIMSETESSVVSPR